jgi:hypothetical protein
MHKFSRSLTIALIMKHALLTAAFITTLAGAIQIVYMDLDDVLPMAGCVLIAEVVSMEAFEWDNWCSGDYSLITLETLHGDIETGAEISCSYHLNLPRICESARGTVAWVSQSETGSGCEFLVSTGDTAIVLLESGNADAAGSYTLLRIEPLDMLDVILRETDIAAIGGPGLCQADQVIQVGEVCTLGFVYSGARWRSRELIELPSGTTFVWDWTNADEWGDVLSMTSETLSITFEVTDISDIEYRCLIPGMPERWKRLYSCLILEASVR